MFDENVQRPKKETLHAELKESVAMFLAERNAKKEAERLLETERAANASLSAKLREKEEAVARFEQVAAENDGDATLQARRHHADATATSFEPLDPDNPMVRKVGANVLSQNTPINC
ncbi:hypothetical protein TrST_g2531 [Triparma strigata]|uniref:Uncharacterized protein n=1 Tax=Triparma strigata TaxID=1606541 RepID=A0A9W7AJZ3_9STRA|nr:hypothetical protein TrST_g2531 [Triparma strigata]